MCSEKRQALMSNIRTDNVICRVRLRQKLNSYTGAGPDDSQPGGPHPRLPADEPALPQSPQGPGHREVLQLPARNGNIFDR